MGYFGVYIKMFTNELLSISEDFGIKSLLATSVVIMTSVLVWDTYLVFFWLLMTTIDFILKMVIGMFTKNRPFPLSSRVNQWILKMLAHSVVIFASLIITFVITRIAPTDIHIMVVNWVLALLICGDCIAVLESLSKMGVPVDPKAFKIFRGISNMITANLEKNIDSATPKIEEPNKE